MSKADEMFEKLGYKFEDENVEGRGKYEWRKL